MEKFLTEIRTYADAVGLKPTTVIQRAGAGNGSTWARWEAGKGSPTMLTADKVRSYMVANPPSPKKEDAAA